MANRVVAKYGRPVLTVYESPFTIGSGSPVSTILVAEVDAPYCALDTSLVARNTNGARQGRAVDGEVSIRVLRTLTT